MKFFVDSFVDNKLRIHFREDKTELIKLRKVNLADELDKRSKGTKIKQYKHVNYLSKTIHDR